ncbi:MAG: FHA domain-containing protein [Anaerolineae bacterium]
MILCPYCHSENPEDNIFCESCNNLLDTLQKTPRIDIDSLLTAPAWGRARLSEAQYVVLRVLGTRTSFNLRIKEGEPLVLGRSEDQILDPRFINLYACNATEKGVSRKHLQLGLQGQMLRVEDLDSTNGTFINGRRLKPHEPVLVRDGDEIQLGQLRIHVLFVSGAE